MLQTVIALITVVLIFAVSALFLGVSALPLRWVLVHFLQIMLFFMASFSLTLLAGQLTGHLLAQLELTLIFQLGLPLLALVLHALCSLEMSTFTNDSRIIDLAYWSVPSALVALGGRISASDAAFTAAPFIGYKFLVGLSATFLVAAGLSVLLYLRRPSERAGSTFIYPRWAYPVKGFLMFSGATLSGLFCSAILEKSAFAFIIGALLAAILIHILTEMAFHRSVRAANRHIPSSVVTLVFTLAVFGIFHTDLLGYDKYVPPAKNVQSISLGNALFQISGVDENIELTDPQDIANAIALTKAFQEHLLDKNHRAPLAEREKDPKRPMFVPSESFPTTLNITWDKKHYQNSRHYTALYKDIAPQMKTLYDSPTFQTALWQVIQNLKPEAVSQLTVRPRIFLEQSGANDHSLDFKASKDQSDKEWIGRLLMAVQADVRTRRFDQLNADPLARVSFTMPTTYSHGNHSERELGIAIYPSDAHTVALLAELQQENRLATDDQIINEEEGLSSVQLCRIDNNQHVEEVRKISDMNTVRDLLKNRTVDFNQSTSFGRDVDSNYFLRLSDGTERYFIKGQITDALLQP